MEEKKMKSPGAPFKSGKRHSSETDNRLKPVQGGIETISSSIPTSNQF
jgi:hypothetical protein